MCNPSFIGSTADSLPETEEDWLRDFQVDRSLNPFEDLELVDSIKEFTQPKEGQKPSRAPDESYRFVSAVCSSSVCGACAGAVEATRVHVLVRAVGPGWLKETIARNYENTKVIIGWNSKS